MPTIQIETNQLLEAASQMPREELERFVARLFVLKARQETPALPERESELLTQINRGLTPETGERMKELITKRQSATISEDEVRELISITDKAERLNVERVKHLIELAALRNVTLDELIDQLGIRPHD